MRQVALGNGGVAQVDDEDFPLVCSYRWHRDSLGYARTNTGGKGLRMHTLIFPPGEGMVVDHINLDKLDNRRSNLRHASRSQNATNKLAYSKSGFKGVYPNKKRWLAKLKCRGEVLCLGTYDTPEEAARAYDHAAAKMFGEFARLNFGGDHHA